MYIHFCQICTYKNHGILPFHRFSPSFSAFSFYSPVSFLKYAQIEYTIFTYFPASVFSSTPLFSKCSEERISQYFRCLFSVLRMDIFSIFSKKLQPQYKNAAQEDPLRAAAPMRRKFKAKRRIAQGRLCRPRAFRSPVDPN